MYQSLTSCAFSTDDICYNAVDVYTTFGAIIKKTSNASSRTASHFPIPAVRRLSMACVIWCRGFRV